MSGTLVANSIQPDVGTNLYLDATQGSGNVVFGNTTTSLVSISPTGNITSRGTITANGISSATGNLSVVGAVSATGNVSANNITSSYDITASSFNRGPLGGMRNRIINGDMRIDQRNAGASQTVSTSGAYTVDRFFVQPTGASITTQRVSGPSGYQYAFRLTGTASVTQCYVQQKIEQLNSYDLAGQTVTVSFTASSSTITSLTCYVDYATAGADNWSTFVTNTTQAITINSTSTRYSFQATLSASATNGIRFIFATGSFTSGTLDITGVQLEKGTTATPFENRLYGTELDLCKRYYQYDSNNGGAYVHLYPGYYASTTGAAVIKTFTPEMRTTPTTTFTAASTFLVDGVSPLTPSAITSPGYGTNKTYRISATVSGATAGQGVILAGAGSGTATITYSAEL